MIFALAIACSIGYFWVLPRYLNALTGAIVNEVGYLVLFFCAVAILIAGSDSTMLLFVYGMLGALHTFNLFDVSITTPFKTPENRAVQIMQAALGVAGTRVKAQATQFIKTSQYYHYSFLFAAALFSAYGWGAEQYVFAVIWTFAGLRELFVWKYRQVAIAKWLHAVALSA